MFNNFSLFGTLIIVGNNAVSEISDFIKKKSIQQVFVLVDTNTRMHCLDILLNNNSILRNSIIIEAPIGEKSKSLGVFEKICTQLISHNISRDSLIINLGGGAISDLGGFLSGVLKRGLRFINVPTTLMSQIDASIGGKVALNIKSYKNQIGLFVNPDLVIVDPQYLSSLLEDEFISAQAEIFKYGLIASKSFWYKIMSIDFSNNIDLYYVIIECIKIKIQIVESDYYDWGDRRKLNFGHSISHAIESVFLEKNNALSHGYALSVGLICESFISYKKYNFSKLEFNTIVNTIISIFPPIEIDRKYDNLILEYIISDKKNLNGISNFTLIKGIGDSIVNCSVSNQDILLALDFYRNYA